MSTECGEPCRPSSVSLWRRTNFHPWGHLKMLNWMNGRRQGYIKTVKCLFLRKKKKSEGEGFKMIVVTLPPARERSQPYKLNPALRVLGSGTTYCLPLRHFQESGHNMLLVNCGSSTSEQRNKAHHGHYPMSKAPHYQGEARLRPPLDHLEEMEEERRGGAAWRQSRTRLELESVWEFTSTSSYRK